MEAPTIGLVEGPGGGGLANFAWHRSVCVWHVWATRLMFAVGRDTLEKAPLLIVSSARGEIARDGSQFAAMTPKKAIIFRNEVLDLIVPEQKFGPFPDETA